LFLLLAFSVGSCCCCYSVQCLFFFLFSFHGLLLLLAVALALAPRLCSRPCLAALSLALVARNGCGETAVVSGRSRCPPHSH
jgi:hypothetical protein